jgi:hypothetical protein
MDMIANIFSLVATFIAGVIGNIVAHDICATADTRCAKIIGRAAKRMAPFDIKATELEWLADLAERETVREKYRHAVGCYLAAPRMRRQATTVTVSVKYIVNSVGTVPLSITAGPIFGMRLINAMCKPTKFSKFLLKAFVVYCRIKILITVHRLGPGCLHRFTNEMDNFTKWDVIVKASSRGRELDFSKLVKILMLDEETRSKLIKQHGISLIRPD